MREIEELWIIGYPGMHYSIGSFSTVWSMVEAEYAASLCNMEGVGETGSIDWRPIPLREALLNWKYQP